MKTYARVTLNVILAGVILALPLLFTAQQPVAAQGPPELRFTEVCRSCPTATVPDPCPLPICDDPGCEPTQEESWIMTRVEVAHTANSNLYGMDFVISFDPNIVQVVDADSSTPGVQVQIPEYTYFEGRDHLVAKNEVDNTNGRIKLVVTLHSPAPPISTDTPTTLALITWKVVGAGYSYVDWVSSRLSDGGGTPINHSTIPSVDQIGCGEPPAPYTGRVWLQGRLSPVHHHKDTLVILATEPCPPSFPSSVAHQISAESIIPDMPYAYTNSAGEFEIEPYPEDDTNYRCLQVFHAGYLSGQKSIPRGGLPNRDLGEITLRGGDVNEDDIINIFDLVKIAKDLEKQVATPGETPDINASGIVDIFDLTIAANNFGTRGPQSDWQ